MCEAGARDDVLPDLAVGAEERRLLANWKDSLLSKAQRTVRRYEEENAYLGLQLVAEKSRCAELVDENERCASSARQADEKLENLTREMCDLSRKLSDVSRRAAELEETLRAQKRENRELLAHAKALASKHEVAARSFASEIGERKAACARLARKAEEQELDLAARSRAQEQHLLARFREKETLLEERFQERVRTMFGKRLAVAAADACSWHVWGWVQRFVETGVIIILIVAVFTATQVG